MKMVWLEVRIVSRHMAAAGVVVLELESVDGSRLPGFDAGAHIDVQVTDGVIRPYSLCSDPNDATGYRLGILLEPESRGGSAGIHESFAAGNIIRISHPQNNFKLEKSAGRTLLIGGGIGITPLISMAYALYNAGQDFELHYCARSRSQAAFVEELCEGAFSDRVHLHFDDEVPAQKLDLQQVIGSVDPVTHVYVCGPGGFMNYVLEGAEAMGWPKSQLHLEYFAAEADLTGDSFEVIAHKSGVRLAVDPGQTIAEVLMAAGIEVSVSCQQGICGTCLCEVIDGRPDHRDLYQTEEEKEANTHVTLCCSRSLTPTLEVNI